MPKQNKKQFIRIKLFNGLEGRNQKTFSMFIRYGFMFFDVMGVELFLSDVKIPKNSEQEADIVFVGSHDFLKKTESFDKSVEDGVKLVKKLKRHHKRVYLFDGGDSTSIHGCWEVFKESGADALFKNQKLKTKELYANQCSFGKWWFGDSDEPLVSYVLTDDEFDKIKLSGVNLGYDKDYGQVFPAHHKSSDKIYIHAHFQTQHDENYNYGFRDDVFYSTHRQAALDALSMLDNVVVLDGKVDKGTYYTNLMKSHYCLSPFGMGEICYRDFEAIQFGATLIKPSMHNVLSIPNIFDDDVNFVSVKPDYSNLKEKFEAFSGPGIGDMQAKYRKHYTHINFLLYWHNILSQEDFIEYD